MAAGGLRPLDRDRAGRRARSRSSTGCCGRPGASRSAPCGTAKPAAESLGVSARRVKLTIYLIAAVGCGMVGALMAISNLRVAPELAFSVDWTAIMFFAVVIGGIGTIEGPILGALVYLVLRQSLAQFGGWYLIILGVSAVIVMRKARRGPLGRPGRPLRPPALPDRPPGHGQERP